MRAKSHAQKVLTIHTKYDSPNLQGPPTYLRTMDDRVDADHACNAVSRIGDDSMHMALFASRAFPHTFYIVAALILFLGAVAAMR